MIFVHSKLDYLQCAAVQFRAPILTVVLHSSSHLITLALMLKKMGGGVKLKKGTFFFFFAQLEVEEANQIYT